MLNDQYPVRANSSSNFILLVIFHPLSKMEISLLLTPRSGVVRISAVAKRGQGVSTSRGEACWICLPILYLNSCIKAFLVGFNLTPFGNDGTMVCQWSSMSWPSLPARTAASHIGFKNIQCRTEIQPMQMEKWKPRIPSSFWCHFVGPFSP